VRKAKTTDANTACRPVIVEDFNLQRAWYSLHLPSQGNTPLLSSFPFDYSRNTGSRIERMREHEMKVFGKSKNGRKHSSIFRERFFFKNQMRQSLVYQVKLRVIWESFTTFAIQFVFLMLKQ
jgi:hypothetical protein